MHQPIATAPAVRRKRKKWKRWVFLGVGVLIVAAIVLIIRQGPKPVPITTEKAAIRDLTQLVSATGKIRPKVEVKISPEVAGEIIEMPVVVGQKVKKGGLLVKIKPDNYIAAGKQRLAPPRLPAFKSKRRCSTTNSICGALRISTRKS
jgi:HlyD family secretion protein